ncbi:flagellar filament capping protein FliD [Mobiluncus mulieris]|uniref:Flagellar hook-associated protein 2 n=1 Tax=Mobiluncus mulieris TaxID=2052 RepID=A0A7Y0U018_9ACTO|nr:flagellar filament capping protein FliD [Mobiluncus mulieris]NMW63973.1 flagellar filament capping protein FliD [Mobiluncus mulieris]
MGISLDGIGGFPTENIVKKLIALEKRPGILLAQKQKDLNAGTKVFRNLNSQLASLTSAAWGISGKKDKFDKTSDPMDIWGAVKGSSNNKGVTVETKTGAKVGSVEFDVVSKATAKREIYGADELKKLTDAMGSNGFSIAIGNKVTHITPASSSMEDMAKAINAVKDAGVSATVVKLRGQDGKEEKMLQLVGKETGKREGDFQIIAGNAAAGAKLDPEKIKHDAASKSTVYTFADHDKMLSQVGSDKGVNGKKDLAVAAQDAHIQMYGKDYYYSSNKLDIMDKVTIDISGLEQQKGADGKNITGEAEKNVVKNVTDSDGHSVQQVETTKATMDFVAKGIKVNLTEDGDVATKKVESMVGALNKVLGTLHQGMKSVEKIRREDDGTESKWKAPGALSNSIGRMVQSQIGSVVSEGITIKDAKGNSQTYSLKDLGIELNLDKDTKEMSIKFDSAKFKELMKKSPETAQKLAIALGDKVGEIGRRLSDSSEGMVTKTIDSRKSESDYYDRRINDFQQRINAKEENMKKQYARLQTALAAFGQKQAWLQGQLAQLNGGMMGGK